MFVVPTAWDTWVAYIYHYYDTLLARYISYGHQVHAFGRHAFDLQALGAGRCSREVVVQQRRAADEVAAFQCFTVISKGLQNGVTALMLVAS